MNIPKSLQWQWVASYIVLIAIILVGLAAYITNAKDANVILATIVSGSIILITSLAFALTILNKTSKLLEDFSEGSHALASGNLEYEFPAYGNQDRKSFASSFNVMARRMRSNVRDLESERSKLSAVLETMNDGVTVSYTHLRAHET